jgi:hypothetical protein
LKAEMIADRSQRVPGFHHAVAGAFAGDGQAVQLARQTDGEIADVDHFLHFAQAFGGDLAGLKRHQRAQFGLGGAQFFAQQGAPVRRAAGREPRATPEGGLRPGDDGGHVGGLGLMHPGEFRAVDGRTDGQRAPGQISLCQPGGGKDFGMGHVGLR